MASSLPGFDRWLEQPYVDAAEAAERFENWCEAHNIEPENPDAETMYMDWVDAQWEEPDYDEFDEYERDDFYDVN